MRVVSSAALVAVLALTGCTGSGASPAPSASASAAAGSFASTADILAALEAKGLPCQQPVAGAYAGVAQAQSCILDDAEDVVLLHFATPAEKAQYLAGLDELASAVVGDDWAVQTVLAQTAEQVAAALGGEARIGRQQPAGGPPSAAPALSGAATAP
ncbi:MAG: hypothetical protein JWM62_1934 [Frankiales bacterium]|nr:hypothetical protein [Frankiales bacterium]